MRSLWKFYFARSAIAAFFLIVTVLQLFSFPGQFNYARQQGKIGLGSQIALTLFLGSWMFAAQFGLVSLWQLVKFMQQGSFFTAQSFDWIQRLVYALRYAAFVPVGLILIIAPQADDPGIMVVLLALLMFSLSLAVLADLLKDQIQTKLPV